MISNPSIKPKGLAAKREGQQQHFRIHFHRRNLHLGTEPVTQSSRSDLGNSTNRRTHVELEQMHRAACECFCAFSDT